MEIRYNPWDFRTYSLLLLTLGALILGVFGTTSAQAHGVKACYPKNQFVILPGDFEVKYSGNGSLKGEIEIPPNSVFLVAAADVQWNFTEEVTGNIGAQHDPSDALVQGQLAITIKWKDPKLATTKFVADCIAEAQEDDGDAFEAEFEGTVSKFPYQKYPRRAVASITGGEGGKVHVGIELGTTCFEQLVSQGDFDEFEINLGGDATKFTFSDKGGVPLEDRGVWSLPDGYPIGDMSGDPCPGVSLFE